MPQKKLLQENEQGPFVVAQIPNSLLQWQLDLPATPPEKPLNASEVEQGRPPSKTSGGGALRSFSAILSESRVLWLLHYLPEQSDEYRLRFSQIAALEQKNARWVELPVTEQPITVWPAMAAKSKAGEKISSEILLNEPLLALPGASMIVCRDEEDILKGALLVKPTLPSSFSLDSAMFALIITNTLLALALHDGEQERQRLLEAEKEIGRTRDAFISFVAHELRNPLTSIKGYAQLLARQARKNMLPDGMIHSVQSIEQQSLRLSEMLGEMLDASRILQSRLEIMPTTGELSLLVKKVVERGHLFFPGNDVRIVGADAPLVGYWDLVRVEQIIRDLLDNAIRHSPEGATVIIELMRRSTDVTVCVRDQGAGIPENEQQGLFGYTYRTPDSERRNLAGVGLGLFVSRHLAERMGGLLWLHRSSTTPPTGSEFCFTLPLGDTPENPQQSDTGA